MRVLQIDDTVYRGVNFEVNSAEYIVLVQSDDYLEAFAIDDPKDLSGLKQLLNPWEHIIIGTFKRVM